VGQPELKLKLQRPDLQQLAQRITVHCHLKGLNEADVGNYISYRLEVAGGDKDKCNIFDPSAFGEIFKHSKGIPRLINIICDTALVYGYADSVKQIDGKIIRDVVKERAAGGLFSPALSDEETAFNLPNKADEKPSIVSAADSAQVLALSRVENALEKANARLTQKWDYRSKRDDLVIELFKMLRQSMDHRLDTLMRVSSITK
jgi:general secretion pathway protein A